MVALVTVTVPFDDRASMPLLPAPVVVTLVLETVVLPVPRATMPRALVPAVATVPLVMLTVPPPWA